MLRRHQFACYRGSHHGHRRKLFERLASLAKHQLCAEDSLLMWRKIAIAIFPVIALGGSTPVILISVDTLRADRLSCYGYRKIRTPHFDSLAKGGTLFGAVESPVPMTLPAHTSLLTSQYPFVHGVEENGQNVKPGAVTLAGVLKSRGYRTAAFIGGYVLDASFGLDQGFDLYNSPFQIHPQLVEDPPELKR